MKKSFSIISTALIFTIFASFYVLTSVFEFVYDEILFAAGSLETKNYSAEDFALKDFVLLENGSIVSTSVDPQLIVYNYNKPCTMISLKFSVNKYQGEVNLYYTKGQEEFTTAQKIWGKAKNDGTYEFIMPRGNLTNIRIDPANFSGVEFKLESAVFNPQRSFLSYFKYSGEEIFMFFAAAILLSCLSKSIYENFYDNLHGLCVKFIIKKKAK